MYSWTEANVKFLKKHYPRRGRDWCASKLGKTASSIAQKVSRLELKVDSDIKSHRAAILGRRYGGQNRGLSKTSLFPVRTKEQAYILGFLWADGYFTHYQGGYSIRLELVSSDMRKIKKLLDGVGSWGYSYRVREGRQKQTRAHVCSKPVFEQLRDAGYLERHLGADEVLSVIPTNLHKHWFHGFFDGDGCIYTNYDNDCYQVTFAGSYKQDWDFLLNYLKSIGIIGRVQRTKGASSHKSSVVRVTNRKGCLTLGLELYGDLTEFQGLGLKRKWDKFSELNDH